MSMAIAYALHKNAKKMAKGGMPCMAHGTQMCEICHGGKMMAEGGFVHEEESSGYRPLRKEHEKKDHRAMKEDDRMLNQHGEYEEGADDMAEDNEPQHERMISHPLENQSDHEDMVGRIMKQRAQHFSKGGRVANKTEIIADFEPNEFDDLAKRDDLEDHYTDANSGDELGNKQEDEDQNDMVSRIMRMRRMRNRGGSGSNERVA